MRIGVHDRGRLGQLDLGHDLEDTLEALGGIEPGVGGEHLVDLGAAAHDRVERGHRLLEDHRHGRAAQLAQASLVDLQQILAFEDDTARDRAQLALRQEAHDAVRGHRLARAELADQAQDFPRAHREAHLLDRAAAIGTLGQRDREPIQLEDGRLGRLAHAALLGAVTTASDPLRQARIEGVAQAIAEHVHREHGQRQKNPWKQDVVGKDLEQQATLGHDVAPGRRLGRNAGAEK